ncbi:MAG: hypothetical protein WA964_08325 [Ilumatobacter sp.]|uniref:hypothetical protein n=1 Tax=Ilumatobacter sp. TaxID=1967498 RepID=UPI003C744A24
MTSSVAEDGVIESIDEVVGTFWRPVTVDGKAIDPEEGDFWEFFADGDGIKISGYDGCNGFGTDDLVGESPPRLEAGVLVDITVGSEAAECPDAVESGPYPASGDVLRLVGDDQLVIEADGIVRVELQRVDSRKPSDPVSDVGQFFSLNSFSDIVRAYWLPVGEDGEPIVSSTDAYWRLGGASYDISLSGFDGCNRFVSEQFPRADGAMVDGTLGSDAVSTTTVECDETQEARPLAGDTFEVSGDGSLVRVTNDGSVRLMLLRISEEPLGTRLRPEQEREAEARMEADDQAEAERFAEETQASIDQVRLDLDAARVRWEAAGIADYVVDFDATCLDCASWPLDPTAIGNRYTIVVENGSGSGPWVDSTAGASVDEWFEYLDTHLTAGGFAQATFDSDLGFPTLLYIALAGPAGADDAVGVDEAQLSDVMLTPAPTPDENTALIGQLVATRWVPLAPDEGDLGVGERPRQWTFSTRGDAFVIEGFDGCNRFSSFTEPDDEPDRLVNGVLVGFDVLAEEAGCPDGVVSSTSPMSGDLLRVVDDGGRLEVVRNGSVTIQFAPAG